MSKALLQLQLAILFIAAALRSRLSATGRRTLAHEGQAFLEYALVLAVVAVIVLVAVQALGVDLGGVFERIRQRLVSLG